MSDSRTISRVRLTTAERGGGDKPLAKPIAAGLIVQPVASVRPGLVAEQFLDFPSTLALDDLISGLRVAGFEGFEDNDQEIDQPLAIPETPAPAPITLSIQRPILEVKPATATAVVYEPMEFLDYEDEEDTYAETETEPVEIFAPPAVLTAFLTVPEPCGAAPSAAKLQSGFGSASFIDAPVEIPVLALQTIRRKLRYGPNPSKPKAVVTKPAYFCCKACVCATADSSGSCPTSCCSRCCRSPGDKSRASSGQGSSSRGYPRQRGANRRSRRRRGPAA